MQTIQYIFTFCADFNPDNKTVVWAQKGTIDALTAFVETGIDRKLVKYLVMIEKYEGEIYDLSEKYTDKAIIEIMYQRIHSLEKALEHFEYRKKYPENALKDLIKEVQNQLKLS